MAELHATTTQRDDTHASSPSSWATRVVLASASAGAGAIHLAMVPSHAAEWTAEGVAFALAGWVQLAFCIAFLVRPSRRALMAAAVSNLAFVAAWAVTRTVGPPFGPEAGIAHDLGFVDVTAVVLEIVVIAVAGRALLAPAPRRATGAVMPASLAIVPVIVLAVSTIAITSTSASDHGHDEAGGHEHAADDGATHDDAETTPHAHGQGPPDPNATPDDDEGLALLSNGEMAHDYGPDEPLDETTRAALVHQLSLTRLVVDAFPTLGDARAAGSEPAGGYVPGMGIHMTVPGSGLPAVPPRDPSVPTIPGILSDDEVLRPTNLLYDGITDDAPIAGLMYYSFGKEEPVGFAGPNDHWHTHGSLCVQLGKGGKVSVLHPTEKTKEGCEAIKGIWVEQTQWMVHVWTVPGYESNRGVFSDINPSIACPDGTYHIVPEEETEKYPLNKCRSNPE